MDLAKINEAQIGCGNQQAPIPSKWNLQWQNWGTTI
jgi:hypothetical protein